MGASNVGQLWQLGRLVVVAVIGLSCALLFHWRGLEHSTWYAVVASLLLCIGLFLAVYDIDKEEAKREWRIVAVAITLGVLCKYLLIFGALYLCTQDWRYGVLAMALAQIDPLSVAALMGDVRMSARAKTVLLAWASFDDPMTALATPIIVGIIAKMAHVQLDTDASSTMMAYGVILLVVGIAALLLLRYRRKNTLRNLLAEPHHRAGAAGADCYTVVHHAGSCWSGVSPGVAYREACSDHCDHRAAWRHLFGGRLAGRRRQLDGHSARHRNLCLADCRGLSGVVGGSSASRRYAQCVLAERRLAHRTGTAEWHHRRRAGAQSGADDSWRHRHHLAGDHHREPAALLRQSGVRPAARLILFCPSIWR